MGTVYAKGSIEGWVELYTIAVDHGIPGAQCFGLLTDIFPPE
jgi:hypothetical protein